MKQWSRTRPTSVAAERTPVAERVLGFLRERYPLKMAENVAGDLRVPAATIRKLEERQSAPSLALFGRMASVYGPTFLAAVFPALDFLADAARADRQRQLEAGIARQRAELDRLHARRPS